MGWLLAHSFLVSMLLGLLGRSDALTPARIDFSVAKVEVAQAAEIVPTIIAPIIPSGPHKKDADSLGVQLTAKSAALVDTASGELLFSYGQDEPRSIASITKLMTALVVLDGHPDWNTKVTVEQSDFDMRGINTLKTGDVLTMRDLWNATLAGSINAGALALARSTGMTRDQFVAKMNAKAAALGMSHTNFADPSGYLPTNTSTALDIARLAYHALNADDIRLAVTRSQIDIRTETGDERHIPATNALLGSFLNDSPFHIIGGKTGYTEEAGYTLTMRAQQDKGDLIAVVLGSPTSDDRFQDMKSLLAWGFRTYEW